ncbi:MAG: polyribonucleotide nucleotidyltransferase [Deltaproteobacteria bacterium]|nr:polyribonucleotide nucleotidyltransferase [Deltaproteobacteria bacterium]
MIKESVNVGGREITLETGRIAKQAGGAVLISLDETVVLVTAVTAANPRDVDFFPLTCDFLEKTYAGGKIPGGFFKREAKQRDDEIVTCRLMDRPIRPMFKDGFRNETQVIATLLSADGENKPDVLSLTGASAALHISEIPFEGPLAGIRIGRIDGEFVAYPTMEEIEKSDMDIILAATRDAIVMVEGGGDEISETDLINALEFGHKAIIPLLDLQDAMRESIGKPKLEVAPPKRDEALYAKVDEMFRDKVDEATRIREKMPRYARQRELSSEVQETLGEEYPEQSKDLSAALSEVKKKVVRARIIETGERIDGRSKTDVRPITCEVGWLPRVHGTGLFTRGETQGIVTTTLGVARDEQRMDGLYNPEEWKKFILHYNFPPYSVGETKFLRGPGRREIGHGALAERALERVLPPHEDFPYTIRVVSEITESNGSSSMATVCGGCLSLMDAGVPIKAPVAGIAMGLIQESDKIAILSDILGDEDHLGDMDFKVAGTKNGVTSVQMDIKIKGLSRDVLVEALEQARQGRLHILGKMTETIAEPRAELSKYAPRITSFKVRPDQIRVIIGPGGKMIKGIVEQTGVDINVEDDGTVNIASSDEVAASKAREIIDGLLREPVVGEEFDGTVARVVDFGCFVNILPNIDGLVHISELDWHRVEKVEDICKEGDEMRVKVLSIESDSGKIRLSRKELIEKPEGWVERPPRDRDRDRGGRDRHGPRGGRPNDRRGGPPPRGGNRGGNRGR